MTDRTVKLNAWDRIMMAITFAEADEAGTARELLTPDRVESRPENRTRKESGRRPELRA